MLTDRAEKDFKKWFSNYSEQYHHLEDWRDYDQYLYEVDLPLSLQQALIIEWLDINFIYTSVSYEEYNMDALFRVKQWNAWVNDDLLTPFNSRQEATTAAIETANKIYNAL